MPNYSDNIVFTKSQEVAIKKLSDFVNMDIERGKKKLYTIALAGAAGTGKTFTLRYVLENSNISRSAVGLACPTHKAAAVLNEATGYDTITLHKALGLKLNVDIDNFDINKPNFDLMNEPKIGNYDIFIVDEASMINKGLLLLLERKCAENNVKLILTGDKYQLPPVNESYSSAFANRPVVELTDIVRQKMDNPVTKWLAMLRDDIICGSTEFIKKMYKSNEFEDVINESGLMLIKDAVKFENKMLEKFNSSIFLDDIDYCKYIAYTNADISNRNRIIRKTIVDNNKELVCKDDLFMAYSTIVDKLGKPIITNSESYIINDIRSNINEYAMKGYYVKLRCVNTNTVSDPIFILNHFDRDSYTLFCRTWWEKHNAAVTCDPKSRSNKWKSYFDFKNKITLCTDIRDANKNLLLGKDIDYGYCITAHKSQGSTYDNIFVNMRDIIFDSNNKTRNNVNVINKLLYVALTRCRNLDCIFL